MRFHVFNVGHGFCAYLIADNGNVMLLDCGHDDLVGFRPSRYLPQSGCTGIEYLVVSHYDEDHLSDLPALRQALPIQVLFRNTSLTPGQIRDLKLREGLLQPGVQSLIEMATTYSATMQTLPDFAGVTLTTLYNQFPGFSDSNNLSLVSFITYEPSGICIVYPGDLEAPGRRALLKQQVFRERLSQVRIFIAAHHGRQNGYLKEIFDFCRPDIVIISDTAIQYSTQEDRYRQHASGIPWDTGGMRRVLTTRSDGNIVVTTPPTGGYRVTVGW